MLFTCIKSWFFRNHLANFHQISYWSFCWNVIDSLFRWSWVYSDDHAPLTVRPIYSSSKLRTAQMMIFSLVVMIGLKKFCITSACLQWLCHSGEQIVAHGPLVSSPELCSGWAIVITFRPSSVHPCVRPSVNIFKQLLLWNRWANFAQISYGASLGWGNKKLLKW